MGYIRKKLNFPDIELQHSIWGAFKLGFNTGISAFPGNTIPGNKARESRDFRVCVFFFTEK